MSDYLIWLIAGLILIIVEVMTGSFYLLVIGVAAFAGALAAFLGAGLFAQVAAMGVVAIIGLIAVNRRHQSRPAQTQRERSLDVGQAVTLESWLDQKNKRVRVNYRGASWEAQLIGDADVQIRDTLFICGADGSQLQVSRSRAA